MKDLIKKQKEELWNSYYKRIEPAMKYMEISKFLSKVRRESIEFERERIRNKVGLLRQYLNEKNCDDLITNKEIETFLEL